MRSLFAQILLLFLGTTLVSLLVFFATSSMLVKRFGAEGHVHVPHTALLVMDEARQAFEEGGRDHLALRLNRIDALLHERHYLTDAAGRDLVDGQDRSDLMAQARSFREPWRTANHERVVLVHASADQRYRLLSVLPPRVRRQVWEFSPFYVWVVLVITFLSYILAVHLARPLRRLRRTVERFGRGDLSARLNSTRRDELGDLARAFDRMAERIETLLNAERRLLQDVSHELRSPLARLHFAVELARTSPDRETGMARIRKEADRLAGLVDELLQLTRAEGDPSSRAMDDVPLHDLLTGLVEDCTLEAEPRGCALVTRIGGPVYVRGEGELFRRAFENVIRNAIRHAPERTAVQVGLELVENVATIQVRDFGPGVPEDDLESIFKPFFRVDTARDRASGGAGLGLSIARRAIVLHQGAMTARNAGPGLLVTFSLPNACARPEDFP